MRRKRDFTRPTPPRALRAFAALLLLVLPAASLLAADDDLLTAKRWSEHSYGVSIRPPKNAELAPGGLDDRLLQIRTVAGDAMELLIKTTSKPIELAKIQQTAVQQMGLAHPSAVILDERAIEMGDEEEAALVYFQYDADGADRLEGQAFVPLDPKVFVMLRLRTDARRGEAARELFEAVLGSLERRTAEELDRIRREEIERGQALLESLETTDLHGALIPERWFRVIDTRRDRDIGYIQIEEGRDTQMQHTGVRIEVQSRIVRGRVAHDTLHEMFLADEGDLELWSIRATARPRRAGRLSRERLRRAASEAETGVRDGELITISRETPSGINEHQWRVPETGYLSQVHAHLLGRLLALREPGTYGFYAYLAEKTKLTFRTYRLERDPRGGYRIMFRPGPEMPAQAEQRNGAGHLLRRDITAHRSLVPASRQQIERRWGE